MKYNISKELFEAVMFKVDKLSTYGGVIKYFKNGNEDTFLVDEFYFRCKKYALEQGYTISGMTFNSGNKGLATLRKIKSFNNRLERFKSTSEQQAVFDACEYIRKEL